MLKALKQAWHGRGHCAPNPAVGAVAVHENRVVAAAYHLGAGTPHAEQRLLDKIPTGLSGLTLYVTLEPCNHWGKTPPCTEALNERQIKQVIYGFKDPNPVVARLDTPKILTQKGIDVLYFPLAQIDDFYQSYAYWTQYKRPWVTVKLAQSLDGKIAGEGDKRINISNEKCSLFTHMKRWQSDLILTTAKTIQADYPQLTARRGKKITAKNLAIIDARLALSGNEEAIKNAKHCYIFHAENLQPTQLLNNCTYYPLTASKDILDLKQLLKTLGALGFHDVWVEAGARLSASLHQQNLVQRTYIYVAPVVLGHKALSAFNENIFMQPAKVSLLRKRDNAIFCLDWGNT